MSEKEQTVSDLSKSSEVASGCPFSGERRLTGDKPKGGTWAKMEAMWSHNVKITEDNTDLSNLSKEFLCCMYLEQIHHKQHQMKLVSVWLRQSLEKLPPYWKEGSISNVHFILFHRIFLLSDSFFLIPVGIFTGRNNISQDHYCFIYSAKLLECLWW